MTPEEFELRMYMLDVNKLLDPELFHSKADDLICEVLKKLGYEKGVKIFENHEKWYS